MTEYTKRFKEIWKNELTENDRNRVRELIGCFLCDCVLDEEAGRGLKYKGKTYDVHVDLVETDE